MSIEIFINNLKSLHVISFERVFAQREKNKKKKDLILKIL